MGRLARVDVAGRIGQRRVGLQARGVGVEIHHRAGVRVQPQVLAVRADHTHPVGGGVEVEAHGAARQGHRGRHRAHRRQRAGSGVERVQAPTGRQGVQNTARDAEVDADQGVAGAQPGHGPTLQHGLRLTGIEFDELVVGGDSPHQLPASHTGRLVRGHGHGRAGPQRQSSQRPEPAGAVQAFQKAEKHAQSPVPKMSGNCTRKSQRKPLAWALNTERSACRSSTRTPPYSTRMAPLAWSRDKASLTRWRDRPTR